MRSVWWFLPILGCGPVRVGEDVVANGFDASGGGPNAPLLDGGQLGDGSGQAGPSVVVTVTATQSCPTCFTLTAQGAGGAPPYTYEWSDGLRDATRTVCPGGASNGVSVVATDAHQRSSSPHALELESPDAGCPAPVLPPLLCLKNPSFEGTPAWNSGVPVAFDATPWTACSNPPDATNTPDVVNDTIPQMYAFVPQPTDGKTFLGLAENEQASQHLCASITGGTRTYLQLDLGRIYIGGGVPDTELGFLEIWGGTATDCSQRELLWASPALSLQWKTYCVTLTPQQFTDQITLRARSDNSLPTYIYLTVDHLVPVESCP